MFVFRFTLRLLYPIKNIVSHSACMPWSLVSFLLCYATLSLSFPSQFTPSTSKQFVVTTSTLMRVHWYMSLWFFIVAKTDALWTDVGYITPKRAKHELCLFDKMPIICKFLHVCFTFQFRPCIVYRRKVWIEYDKWEYITLHTNRSLLATLWCNTLTNMCAELEMLNWKTPLVVIISMYVLCIEINNRLVCKKSSHKTAEITWLFISWPLVPTAW